MSVSANSTWRITVYSWATPLPCPGERRDRAQDVAFVVGGAYGLDAALRSRSSMVLSLAAWTLPHELARLVLAEQLYRAGTLLRGEPYHK